jgi:hypothetical protein
MDVRSCPQMTGHGSKLGRKMDQAIIAVVSSRSMEDAAKSVGASVKTLYRWQKVPEFAEAYREARTATFRQCVARLEQASGPAVTTLRNMLVDPKAPLAVKARSAYYILDQTRKAVETEDIEARVAKLERAAEASKTGRK